LILEDDAKVHPKIGQKLAALKVPDDWDIILLGTVRLVPDNNVSHEVTKVLGFWGMHGYLVNKKSAKKLSDAFENDKMDAQIDSRISFMIQIQSFKVYALREQLVIINVETEGQTDIQCPIREDSDSFIYRGVRV
jgi:GR25 family glycosyltransferase involved in LPS biosynthesis